jgi:putative ATP-dependent endonuclease of the OLD family
VEEDTAAPWTEVDVTLVDLGDGLEQLLGGRLELLDPATGEPATRAIAASAVLGVRLCYRLLYDEHTGTDVHWVDYPHFSDQTTRSFVRVSRQEREALPYIALHRTPALQLRADGLLRGLIEDTDSAGRATALGSLSTDGSRATETFSSPAAIRTHIAEVLDAGAGLLLELTGPDPQDRFSLSPRTARLQPFLGPYSQP